MKKIIDWYHGLTQVEPIHLHHLMIARKNLSCISYNMATELDQKCKDFYLSNGSRKINTVKSEVKYLDEGISKAKVIAENENTELREFEAVAEGEFRGSRIVLEQLNQVIQSMNQDIAYLRKEYEQEQANNKVN